jgi:hypothetical protein
MPKGTTLVFGSWVCTANGSGGYISHLAKPRVPKASLEKEDIPAGCFDNLDETLISISPKGAGKESIPNMIPTHVPLIPGSVLPDLGIFTLNR